MQWTDSDLARMASRGVTREEVERQLELLRHPPPPIELVRPCAPGDGIRLLSAEEAEKAPEATEDARRRGRMMKFVPASGAATRMFQALLSARAAGAAQSRDEARRRAAAGDDNAKALLQFVDGLTRFAFYGALREVLHRDGLELGQLVARGELEPILDYLLTAKGLDCASLPKGLLPFHRYGELARTAFEEHLVEAARYVRAGDARCHLHFTVSPEHEPRFTALSERVRRAYEERFEALFAVDFSQQKPSTDTIAIDRDGEPFRDENAALLFRPGGHGALIENLNDLRADIAYVKNVDNVVPEHLAESTVAWKQALGACLLAVQTEIFRHLDELDRRGERPAVETAERFARAELCLMLPATGELEQRRALLRRKLDRPLRVCGTVKNTGEPGGGPFWVRGPDGSLSLQIIESAQVDPNSPEQRAIFASSRYFNPVDLVCGVRDRRGQPYDLRRYTDPSAVFIARKSSGGRDLHALERPGLWNGAMADWNTVFVEVPIETFNPVKTVLDLLRPQHQPKTGS